jgi:hypothetical protein
MPYNNSTPTYRIPFMSQGELSSGSSNMRQAFILDSQLQGVATIIGSTGIINEGSYQSIFTAGNLSTVNLLATAQNYAMEAYVNGVFVQQNTTIQWAGLPDSTANIYLYIQTQENNLYMSNQASSLQSKIGFPVFNTIGLTPVNSILIGIATTTGSSISLNISPSISDSSFAQRPVLVPYNQHRTAIPIDHPYRSILWNHLSDYVVRSNTLAPWDGITSGTSSYATLSGTGVASIHIKPQAVTSQALAPALSVSGLQIQAALTAISGATTTLSGVTLSPGYQGQNVLELVPLQVLQTNVSGLQASISGLNSFDTGIITILGNNFSGLQANVIVDENNIFVLQNSQSGINNTVLNNQGRINVLVGNQSGISNNLTQIQNLETTLVSNFSGLQNNVNNGNGRVVTSNDLTGQTGSISSLVTFNIPNDGKDHTFSVGAYSAITAISAGSLTFQIAFTDENDVPRTITYFPMGLTSAALTTTGFTAFTPATIRGDTNTSITISSTFTGVSIAYDAGAYIVQIS